MSLLSSITGGDVLGAAAGLLGDFMGSQGQSSANQMNWNIAQSEMQWQERMANTQMQRRVQDLRKAGLNPLLAVGGPGAAMPSVVQPQMQNARQAFSNLGPQVTNAMALATQQAQINLMNAQAKKAGAETPAGVGVADKDLTDFQYKLRAEGQTAFQEIGLQKLRQNQLIAATNNLVAELPKISAQATTAQTQANYSDAMARITKQFAEIGNILAEAREPEAKAAAEFFKHLGALGTGGTRDLAKMGIQTLMMIFGKFTASEPAAAPHMDYRLD